MRNLLSTIIFAVSFCVFLVSVAWLGDVMLKKRSDAGQNMELREQVWEGYDENQDIITSVVNDSDNTASDQVSVPEVPAYVPPAGLVELMDANPFVVGWIKVEGTDIDYPIVQNRDDYNYFLKRDINGKKSAGGSIFLDSLDYLSVEGIHIIYGHHMKVGFKGGTMFRDVGNYVDAEYMSEHSDIRIYTREKVYILKPIYCYNGKADISYREALLSRATPADFVREKTGIETDSENIFILLTCSYGQRDARTYLICEEV